MKKFKCRCSAIGTMMTDNQKRTGIGKTAISYLEEWAKEQIYGRSNEKCSKYTDKGNVVEDSAIDIAIEHLKLPYEMKNEKHFSNEYFTGTPDLVDNKIDIKSSWDCFTFPLFEKELPEKKYNWQAQGYMDLTGENDWRVVYVLDDTPIHLIEKEARYTCNGRDYDEYLQECIARMTYSHIPLEYRVKEFVIKRDQRKIDAAYERVELCRAIIESYQLPIEI